MIDRSSRTNSTPTTYARTTQATTTQSPTATQSGAGPQATRYEDSFEPAKATQGGNPVLNLASGGGGPVDWAVDKVVEKLSDLARNLPNKPLSDEQKAEMKKVFGDSVNLDEVRIATGPAELFDGIEKVGRYTPAFTVGNTIIVNPKELNADGSLKSKSLLTHEMTHVWQGQKFGGDYVVKALVAQSLGEGYDWKKSIDEGKKWEDLNPEQQGELIQDAYESGFFDSANATYTEGGKDYTAAVRDAVEKLRRGEGEPNWDASKATNPVKKVWDRIWN
jgi:hypothetical protein